MNFYIDWDIFWVPNHFFSSNRYVMTTNKLTLALFGGYLSNEKSWTIVIPHGDGSNIVMTHTQPCRYCPLWA